MPTTLVILESPYAGNRALNDSYLMLCIRDSLSRGESPYASHKMIPGALDDALPEERTRGIQAGYAWHQAASRIVFYADLGFSRGMRACIIECWAKKLMEVRFILSQTDRDEPNLKHWVDDIARSNENLAGKK